jgi:hypothetical protein
MELEYVADIFTIVASIIAMRVIITWYYSISRQRKPLKLAGAVIISLTDIDAGERLRIELKNRLPHSIRIRGASLYYKKRFVIRDLGHDFYRGVLMRPFNLQVEFDEGGMDVISGAFAEIDFRYTNISEENDGLELVKNIVVDTDRGSFLYLLVILRLIIAEVV